MKKSRTAKKSPKKTPKKTPKKAEKNTPKKKEIPKTWVVTKREIIDNVVHYVCKHSRSAIPIYDFTDYGPIFEFEMAQASVDQGKPLCHLWH